jgi:CheY-like chemotaxis protein
MQMPERDGLGLVKAIRLHDSQIPVVLMTAHGSDQLAVQALEQGAAGYVSKERLKDRLVETVEDVLSIARADRTYTRLIGCLSRTEFDFQMENDPQLIDPLVDLTQQIVAGMGLCDTTGRYRIGMALKAAVHNAMFRGNLEIPADNQASSARSREELLEARRADSRYCNRKLHVRILIQPTEARFEVRDEGPGFDVSSLPPPGDATSLEKATGRGLVLMRSFMDDVVFNAQGNQVALVKRRE